MWRIHRVQDVHARYRTEAHHDVQPRFNERFILSLGSCSTCLVLDDELNVLPISGGKDISADPSSSIVASTSKAATELANLKASLADTPIVGPLAKLCATTDQLRGLLTFAQSGIASKTLSSTISLTAGRGRGKSAALGLAIAAAVAHDYSNIFVTSPTPENLKTLFEFVAKGLNAMGYEETLDYEVVRTGNEDWGRAVVRINIFKGHRQTIQVSRVEIVTVDNWIDKPVIRSISNRKTLTFLAKPNFSSSMRQLLFLFLSCESFLDHTSSSWLPQSTVMKGQVDLYPSSSSSNFGNKLDLSSRRQPTICRLEPVVKQLHRLVSLGLAWPGR